MGYDTMGSETPIVPILMGSDEDTFAFWKMLDDRGIFANPVVAPGTPVGKGLIRTSYMASHKDEEIQRVIDVFEELARITGRLPAGFSAARAPLADSKSPQSVPPPIETLLGGSPFDSTKRTPIGSLPCTRTSRRSSHRIGTPFRRAETLSSFLRAEADE
jgi:hypothetical protein